MRRRMARGLKHPSKKGKEAQPESSPRSTTPFTRTSCSVTLLRAPSSASTSSTKTTTGAILRASLKRASTRCSSSPYQRDVTLALRTRVEQQSSSSHPGHQSRRDGRNPKP
jgi:hypothetical protein